MHLPLFRIFLFLLTFSHAVSATPPQVVVSIAPIHAITSAVMRGIASPKLLIEARTSPHDFHLRPSQLIALQSADLFIWVSPILEQGLAKVSARSSMQEKSLTLLEQAVIKKLKAREAGIWEDEKNHHNAQVDPHIWLSPSNAIEIARIITKRLSDIDSINIVHYRENLASFEQKVTMLEQVINTEFNLKGMPSYLVLHDAFQYFEKYFKLPAAGAVSIDPEHSPGVRRIQTLRNYIREHDIGCIFREPQLSDRMLNSISQGLEIQTGILDPIGNEGDSYTQLIQSLSQQLRNCKTSAE